MSKPIRAGDLRVVSLKVARRQCAAVALAAFVAGSAVGLYSGHSAWAADGDPLRASLKEIGSYLCQKWDGVKSVWRVGKGEYGFACYELAVFPRVPLTLKEER